MPMMRMPMMRMPMMSHNLTSTTNYIRCLSTQDLRVLNMSLLFMYAFSITSSWAQTSTTAPTDIQATPLIEWSSPYLNQVLVNQDTTQNSFLARLVLPVLEAPIIPSDYAVKYAHKLSNGSLAFTAHPLPLIVTQLGSTVTLDIENQGDHSAILTQSLLSARTDQFMIDAQHTHTIQWQAEWVGASSYQIRRGNERWVGMIVVLPADQDEIIFSNDFENFEQVLQVYTLNLSTLESQADTRRAYAWSWQLYPNTPRLSRVQQVIPKSLLSSAQAEIPIIQFQKTLGFVNVSNLPIALDLPPHLLVQGGTLTNAPKPENVDRIPIDDTRGPLRILAPGHGCLIWSSQAVMDSPIFAYGYTALGGRSWTPTRLLVQLNSGGMNPLPNPTHFTRLPIPKILQKYPILQNNIHNEAWSWSANYTWVYQGSHRTKFWRMNGTSYLASTHTTTDFETDPNEMGQANNTLSYSNYDWGLFEIRNLSSSGHRFASTLGPHYSLNTETNTWQINTVSWIEIRDKIRVLIPHDLKNGEWEMGVLYDSENEDPHPLKQNVSIQTSP
jgi:hypothetical protein